MAHEESAAEQSVREVKESFDKELRSKAQDWSSSGLLNEKKIKQQQPGAADTNRANAAAADREDTVNDAIAGRKANQRVGSFNSRFAILGGSAIAGVIAVWAVARSRLKRPRGPIGTHRKFTV
jgi:hypothetical protein